MLRINDGFIGTGYPNMISSTTTEVYNYNEYGHRCKSLDQLDKNNYILFAGCSHTEGVGLSVEDTYPYITSNYLKSDYYNLGVGGSGCDVMIHNTLLWLHKFDHKPKLLVIQWPFELRYIRESTVDEKFVETEGSWSKDNYLDFMLLGDSVGYFPLRTKLYIKLLSEIKIPKIYISFTSYNRHLTNYITFQNLDKANDNQHLGPLSHKFLAENIYNVYIKKTDKYLNVDTYSTTRGQSD